MDEFVGIEFKGVTQTPHGRSKPILRDLNARFAVNRSTAVLGFEARPLRTIVDLVTGAARLRRGEIKTNCSVSPPIAYAQGLGRYLTGRQNAAFLARLFNLDIDAMASFVQEFSEIGGVFDLSIASYSPEQRSRLFVSLSYALPFDMYLSGGTLIVGSGEFRKKCTAYIQEEVRPRAGIMIATTSPQMVRTFCDDAYVLVGQELSYFKTISQAIRFYKDAKSRPAEKMENEFDDDVDEEEDFAMSDDDYSVI